MRACTHPSSTSSNATVSFKGSTASGYRTLFA